MASRVHCLKRIGENVKKYRTVILEGKDEATIGRSPDATLCILSVMISRCHAILKKSETGAWTIKDNKSLNGVFVNDKKLEPLKPYELNEGDIVQFGVREKPDTPPEFLYRYHTALKLSRKVDQTDGPVANSQVKRIKLEGEKVSNTSSVSPSKSKQETSPYQQYRQKIDEQDAQTTAKMSQLEEKLKEMQQLLQEKEAAQQEMAMELQEEKTKRENQSKALECLKKKEEDMQHELVKQQELLTKEKEELESRMREELEDQLQAKEADLMENLENQKTALLKEKEEIENRLKEQLETEREKDKQLADELMQQKQKLEKIIENKEVEKKLLESQLKDTTLEKDQKQEEVLRAREDVLSNFAELMETELQCSICNELFVKATSLNCSHSFCFLCISQWLKVKNECPQCRSAVTTCTKSIVLDSYIEKMVEQFSEDMKRSRQELVEERKKEEAAFEEANKPKPPATRGGRGRGRGRAGRGRGQANTAASTRAPNPTVFNPPPPLPILISDETSDEIDGDNDGFVSLSDEENSDSDSSVEGDGDVYYGGYGRCYNCGAGERLRTIMVLLLTKLHKGHNMPPGKGVKMDNLQPCRVPQVNPFPNGTTLQ